MRNNNYIMASFDITSLFTNIPIKETIDIILNQIFVKSSELFYGFTKTEFASLLELCTKDNMFLFDGKLYKQIDGAPMGGCVSPI
jgi:hypothetical protein